MTGNPKLFLSRTGFREVDAVSSASAAALSPGATINGTLFTGASNITITATASSIASLIAAGTNITITGAGTIASPYVITATDEPNEIVSNTLGGATIVTNVVTITRANYNALSPPDAQTLYFING